MKPLRGSKTSLPTTKSISRPSPTPRHLHHRPRPQHLPFQQCTHQPSPRASNQTLHTSATLSASTPAAPVPARQKPTHQTPYRTITPAELDRIKAARASIFKSYTASEKSELARRYNKEQLAAIEAGEAAINTEDLGAQWRIRGDHLNTVRDLDPHANSRILPTIDFTMDRINKTGSNYLERMAKAVGGNTFLNYDPSPEGMLSIALSRARVADPDSEPPEPDDKETDSKPSGPPQRFPPKDLTNRTIDSIDPRTNTIRLRSPQTITVENTRADTEEELNAYHLDPGEAEQTEEDYLSQLAARARGLHKDPHEDWDLGTSDAEAPIIPKINDPAVRWGDENSVDPEEEVDEEELRLKALSDAVDISPEGVRKFKITLLTSDFVANMTGLGKIYRWRVVACAGNGDGLVGLGMGGSTDKNEADRIAGERAIRNMVPIPRYERRTIYGEIHAKVGAVEVQLNSRPPGFGLRVQERVHAIAIAAGLSDLSARVNRSRNKMNTCYAVWEALKKQREPEELARARGVKMVDVRRVYYNGLV